MANPINPAGFRKETALELLALLKSTKGKPRAGLRSEQPELPMAVPNFICVANADIEALSGSAPGSGTATLWNWNAYDELEETETEFTVFNLSGAAITAGKFLIGIKVGTRRVIIFEACGDESGS